MGICLGCRLLEEEVDKHNITVGESYYQCDEKYTLTKEQKREKIKMGMYIICAACCASKVWPKSLTLFFFSIFDTHQYLLYMNIFVFKVLTFKLQYLCETKVSVSLPTSTWLVQRVSVCQRR